MEKKGAKAFVPPLKDLDDIKKLKYPTVEVNWKESQKIFQTLNEIIGNILKAKSGGYSLRLRGMSVIPTFIKL